MWKYCTKEQCNELIFDFKLLDYENSKTLKILYSLSNNTNIHYNKYKIPKRKNCFRTIYEPDYLLKTVQTNILNNILNDIDVSKYATAYKKGKSVSDNAKPHVNKKIILKMDIENFFENITYEKVYNQVFKTIYFPYSVKTLLSNLCCYEGYTPQGAPTSPYISNIILKDFDEYIGNYCKKINIDYTRYSDDMTFSGEFDIYKIKNKVTCFLKKLGFNINSQKTKVLYQNNRQTVTNVVVNKKLQTSKNYRKIIRQEVYYINKFGLKNHLTKLKEPKEQKLYLSSLLGKINYCLAINKEDEEMNNYKKVISKLHNLS